MKNKQINLSQFDNSWYKPANKSKVILWYFVNMFIFKTLLPIPSSMKVKVLRLFGSMVGESYSK